MGSGFSRPHPTAAFPGSGVTHTGRGPSNVDDARAGTAAPTVVPVGRKYTSRRLCMSASVLGAGVHGIGAWMAGVSGVSSAGVWGVGGVGGSEGRSDAPEKVSRPSAGSYTVTNVSAVCGGTSSDQRCCRWLLRGIAVLEELLSLCSVTCGANPVLMINPGGVCRLVRSWREEWAQHGIPKRSWPGCGGECMHGVVAWCRSSASVGEEEKEGR